MKDARRQVGPSIHRYSVRETEEPMERYPQTETETETAEEGVGGRGKPYLRTRYNGVLPAPTAANPSSQSTGIMNLCVLM